MEMEKKQKSLTLTAIQSNTELFTDYLIKNYFDFMMLTSKGKDIDEFKHSLKSFLEHHITFDTDAMTFLKCSKVDLNQLAQDLYCPFVNEMKETAYVF